MDIERKLDLIAERLGDVASLLREETRISARESLQWQGEFNGIKSSVTTLVDSVRSDMAELAGKVGALESSMQLRQMLADLPEDLAAEMVSKMSPETLGKLLSPEQVRGARALQNAERALKGERPPHEQSAALSLKGGKLTVRGVPLAQLGKVLPWLLTAGGVVYEAIHRLVAHGGH